MPWVAPAVDDVAQGDTTAQGRLKVALKTFGYLSDDSDDATWDLPEALVAFQLAADLPVTGVYDGATAVVLERSRCGVPDTVDLDSVRANRTRESSIKTYSHYQLYDNKWNHTDMTYRIDSFCDGLTQDEVKQSIKNALLQFMGVTPLTFTLVDANADTPDISFSFQSGDHGDGHPFHNDNNDLPNTLAHAWGPPPNTYSNTVTVVHFDKDDAWTVDLLTQTALHEIGHALGLDHSNVRKASMYAELSKRSILYADDIAGIQAKYGCRGDRWSSLDNNSDTAQIAATHGSLFQRHKNGLIYKYAPAQSDKWSCIDNTKNAIDIVAGGGILYKRQSDGGVYQYSSSSWVNLDTNTSISAIAVGGYKLYKLHSDGSIYKYDLTSGNWISLDNDSTVTSIVADSIGLYKLDNSGNAYTYSSDGKWVPTGSYSDTTQIAAAGGVLYQLRQNGGIFEYPSWDECGRNTDTLSIAAGGEDLFQRHVSSIWRYTGTAESGWQQVDGGSDTASIYVSDVGTCYQLHKNGQIWLMTN
jgi:hypothetical protein